MQAAEREGGIRIGPGMRMELPEHLLEGARLVLAPLFEWLFTQEPLRLTVPHALSADVRLARVEAGLDGWWLEHGRYRERTASEEMLLLRLQEIGLEAVARNRQWLLFRGSVMSRGSQSLLIVGGQDNADVILATALSVLRFRPVSIGLAAFDGRSLREYPMPLPLPLAFALSPEEQTTLRTLPHYLEEHLVPLTATLFRASRVIAAPEPTHILFPDATGGARPLLLPVSRSTARARLCGALTFSPDDVPPFAPVAAMLRHTRALHLPLEDLPQTLEQLARLLPYWGVD